ncbi:unnamed protein product [Protopolystoma xenopodis]|uniref:Uncharacterized protein n=1 Tax=Protopolystoma xenopodis TaxID=117903 RepID=A0A3S5CN81_9PLAT|nr:unnamed protein product [Protopolystoma xenopodis]
MKLDQSWIIFGASAEHGNCNGQNSGKLNGSSIFDLGTKLEAVVYLDVVESMLVSGVEGDITGIGMTGLAVATESGVRIV